MCRIYLFQAMGTAKPYLTPFTEAILGRDEYDLVANGLNQVLVERLKVWSIHPISLTIFVIRRAFKINLYVIVPLCYQYITQHDADIRQTFLSPLILADFSH